MNRRIFNHVYLRLVLCSSGPRSGFCCSWSIG